MDELFRSIEVKQQITKSKARGWSYFDIEDQLEALVKRVDTLQAALEKILGVKL